MLTVIFGAGASYDSDPSNTPDTSPADPDRLPLANELFDGRRQFLQDLTRFRQCFAIVPWLRHLAPRTSIEQVLERLQDESTSAASPDPERVLRPRRNPARVKVTGSNAAMPKSRSGLTGEIRDGTKRQ